MGLLKTFAASLAALHFLASPVSAVTPSYDVQPRASTPASTYWLANIKHQGVAVFSGNSSFQIFRNVKDFGAVGDGTHDDTAAINSAIYQDGDGRCAQNCGSSTTHPAIVYFPPGTYLISSSIIQTYYTQLIGDAVDVPTIKASATFNGSIMIDSNPYGSNGQNWYVNQNNFFRQIRNFNIDTTGATSTTSNLWGIHWQVAQATSLQNIVFNMDTGASSKTTQIGVYMENGSGGFFTDLTFNGGSIGVNLGSQQFTTRNLTFNNCDTAVMMIWDWVWLMQGVTINGGQVGINLTGGYNMIGNDPTAVGSFILKDSKISNVGVGIVTPYQMNQTSMGQTSTNGTLILDNVDMSAGVPIALNSVSGRSLIGANQVINGFVQGTQYVNSPGRAVVQGAQQGLNLPKGLTDGNGNIFTRNKPQYETVALSNFKSVKDQGAKGDGITDDTAAIQKILDDATADDIIYFDFGAYIITDTIKVPKNIKITGEIWPLLMASGSNFANETNPRPVLQIGQPGDVGNVELSELIIETKGAVPGAILMEWNVAGSAPGSAGMWDVHFRVGGSQGSDLQWPQCPNTTTTVVGQCMGSFMMLHLTQSASAYIENSWAWVADHELDIAPQTQELSIYNGRGILIESQKPVWMWGTASEHSVLYNYQIANAQNLFIGVAQTETAYMQGQGHTDAEHEVDILETPWLDPDFRETCAKSNSSCARTWGMRIVNSSDIYVLGAGMYSFFDGYDQTCLLTEDCQENMISIENSAVQMYAVNTKASANMISVDGEPVALDRDNRNTYCAGVARYESNSSGVPSSSNGTSTYSSVPAGSSTASSSAMSLSSYPVQTPTSGTPLPPGGYGEPGSDTSSTALAASQPSVTTLPIPLSAASSSVDMTTLPASTVTTQSGPAGSSGSGATVTVTETVTAPGTCQTP
ncbi:glycoside hydrolase family 55 protein [Xylariaceae sp. FL0255]|nr:glycoside hydrolase family 55 protein [Xylariaceae sp. FL0255]